MNFGQVDNQNLGRILTRVPTELREALLVELVLVGLEYAHTSPRPKIGSDTTNADGCSPQTAPTGRPANGAQPSPVTPPTDDPGTQAIPHSPPRILGGYELLDELGRGGMGVVYRARQINVDRMVALKIIKDSRFECTNDARCAVLLERFRTETKAASRLDGENIATVYDVGQFEDAPYFAMRLVEGVSLGALVQAGPLPADRATRYLVPIARTIAKLHRTGVVHRDLKPSNILIETVTDKPILTDFGLAKLTDDEQNVTLSDEGFGSPPYMAPEQVLHATSVTGAADIYSLGATLYHLLTGRPPFQAGTLPEIARQIVFCEVVPPRQLNASIPRDLETICLKCLEKDEPRRYATADGLADDLQRFLDHRPIVARRIGKIGRAWKWSRRNPSWAILAIILFVLLNVSTVAYTVLTYREGIAAELADKSGEEMRRIRSDELFDRSQFAGGENSQHALPWLIAGLKLDADTPRERTTRQRIRSVLDHGAALTQLYCHDGPVMCAQFGPDGDRLLTGCADRSARIWSVATGACRQSFAHDAPVRHAEFNHRGNLAATAADDGTVQLWTLETGQKHGPALAHPGHLRFARFSPDDEFLVTASSDEHVRVWRTSDASLHTVIDVGDSEPPVLSVALSPDGIHGASAAGNSCARLWNLRTGAFSPVELRPSGEITSLRFSPDGTLIATGSGDGVAKVWETATGHLVREYPHSSAVKHVDWVADPVGVITATDDTVHFWPQDAARAAAVVVVHSGLKTIEVDPTGAAVLTTGDDRTARLWDLRNGRPLGGPYLHAGEIAGAHFSADGTSVVTYSADGTARIWNGREHWRRSRIDEISNVVASMASSDGRSILVRGTEQDVGVFQVDDSEVDHDVFTHIDTIVAACISPDGSRVSAADANGNVVVWNRGTEKVQFGPVHHAHAVRALAFSPGNNVLAAGDSEGNVTVYEMASSKPAQSFKLSSEVTGLTFSASGDYLLATGLVSAQLALLNHANELELSLSRPVELGSDIRGARFGPDGRFAVIYGATNRVVLWNISGGSRTVLHTTSAVNDICFMKNSSEFLTSGQDGTAEIWRTVDGTPIHHRMKCSSPLVLGAFSPDGQTVALSGDDCTARVWQVSDGRPVTIPLTHTDRIRHLQFVDSERLLTLTERGEVRIFDIAPTPIGIEELRATAILLGGTYVDDQGGLISLSPSDVVSHCREMQAHGWGRETSSGRVTSKSRR